MPCCSVYVALVTIGTRLREAVLPVLQELIVLELLMRQTVQLVLLVRLLLEEYLVLVL